MLSSDMVEYLSSWSLKNFTQGDDQVPLSSSHHSKDSEIYKHLVHYLLPIMEKKQI